MKSMNKHQLYRLHIPAQNNTLLRTYWIFVGLVFGWALLTATPESMASGFAAFLIAVAALLPAYLWCSGKALGMPIFPLFSLTYLWTYAFQLLGENSTELVYSPSGQIFAGITVTSYLGLGTLIWFKFVSRPTRAPKNCRYFDDQKAEPYLWLILTLAILFKANTLGGWIEIQGGLFSLIQASLLGLSGLALFVLAYRWGKHQLSVEQSRKFLLLLIIYMVVDAASLLLVGAMATLLLATMAFIVGRRKVPWALLIVGLVCCGLLHYGKSDMRQKYWPQFSSQEVHHVQPWDYPAWYGEWLGHSLNYLQTPQEFRSEERASALERSSLMHLLLMIQDKTPQEVPYMFGETYTIIPQLLVPRFLSAHKIASHEGTYLLSIHYGLQTREETSFTTIGFGLLNEAYANFGMFGCAVLAVVLGALYGQVARWSMYTPVLSFRFLVAVVLMGFAFQTEFSAGVYVAALYQSIILLAIIAFLFMKVLPNKEFWGTRSVVGKKYSFPENPIN
jgi:hypothetical protein